MSNQAEQDWPDYLRAAMKAVGIKSASEFARETGITEPVVSRWLKGTTQPDVVNLRRVAPVLGVPLLQLLVAAGHLTAAEAKLKEVTPPKAQPVDVLQAIDLDPQLIPEARTHLRNQYGLLLRVTAAKPDTGNVTAISRGSRKTPLAGTEDQPVKKYVARKRTAPSPLSDPTDTTDAE